MTNFNTSAHLGNVNASMDTWQGKLAEGEGAMQRSILGDATISSGTLRQNMHVAAQVLGFLRENLSSWLQEAKEEQRMMREMRLDGTKDLATA